MEFSVMDQPLCYHSVASCPHPLKDSCHMDKRYSSQGTCEEKKKSGKETYVTISLISWHRGT